MTLNKRLAIVRPEVVSVQPVRCPACGGTQIQAVAPGLYECVTPVVKDVVAPGVHANPSPIPLYGTCGRRFQGPGARFDLGLCGCGMAAVAVCARCDPPTPLCLDDALRRDGAVTCAAHARAFDAEVERKTQEELARCQRAIDDRWSAAVEKTITALAAISDPNERLLVAIRQLTGSRSGIKGRSETRIPGALLFSAAFPELWPSPADVDLNATEPAWDSPRIARWFAAEAQRRGIRPPEPVGGPRRAFGIFPRHARTWHAHCTRLMKARLAGEEHYLQAWAVIGTDGSLSYAPPGSPGVPVGPTHPHLSAEGLAQLAEYLQLSRTGVWIVTTDHGGAWPWSGLVRQPAFPGRAQPQTT